MLEKEKEVMESAWQDGMYECDGDGTFEDFYKTFNTKERWVVTLLNANKFAYENKLQVKKNKRKQKGD